MTTVQDASNALLSVIAFLPREPPDSEFLQFGMHFAGIQLMSASDRALVLDEVCEATRQLADVREKLVVPMGQSASTISAGLIGIFLDGSRKTISAMLCVETLNFMRWLIQKSCDENHWQMSASCLMTLTSCSEANPREFARVFLNSTPEDFIKTLAATLENGIVVDVSPQGFSFQALRFIQHHTGLLKSDACQVVLKHCCVHIWPVVVKLLLVPEVPDAWLVDDVPFCERGSRGAEIGHRKSFPSFLEVLLHTLRCFHSVKMEHSSKALGRSGTIDMDLPLVYFSDDLLHRLTYLAKTRNLPDQVQARSLEVLNVLKSKHQHGGKHFLRTCQARDEKRDRHLASVRQDEVLEYSTCGNPACSAKETKDVKFHKCSGCMLQRYCSKECQKKAWKQHKAHCLNK